MLYIYINILYICIYIDMRDVFDGWLIGAELLKCFGVYSLLQKRVYAETHSMHSFKVFRFFYSEPIKCFGSSSFCSQGQYRALKSVLVLVLCSSLAWALLFHTEPKKEGAREKEREKERESVCVCALSEVDAEYSTYTSEDIEDSFLRWDQVVCERESVCVCA